MINTFRLYLYDWWAGDVTSWTLLGLKISQANKIASVVQYIAGLTVLFDLVRYADVMTAARLVVSLAVWAYMLVKLIIDLPILVLRILVRLVRALFSRQPILAALKQAVLGHVAVASTEATDIARNNPASKVLVWLAANAVPERIFRIANFVVFVIFSAVQLLTS